MSAKQRSLDYDHWSSDWLDVTELQAGYEIVFAAEHRETGVFVTLAPAAVERPGALDPSVSESEGYKRVVRPRQGAPALREYGEEYRAASKQDALTDTHEWLSEHEDGLEAEVDEA